MDANGACYQVISRSGEQFMNTTDSGDKLSQAVKELTGASVEVVKRNVSHSFTVIPKRWVVERSFAWLEKCRRLWKNCERKINSSLQFVVIAFIYILFKKIDQDAKNLAANT